MNPTCAEHAEEADTEDPQRRDPGGARVFQARGGGSGPALFAFWLSRVPVLAACISGCGSGTVAHLWKPTVTRRETLYWLQRGRSNS